MLAIKNDRSAYEKELDKHKDEYIQVQQVAAEEASKDNVVKLHSQCNAQMLRAQWLSTRAARAIWSRFSQQWTTEFIREFKKKQCISQRELRLTLDSGLNPKLRDKFYAGLNAYSEQKLNKKLTTTDEETLIRAELGLPKYCALPKVTDENFAAAKASAKRLMKQWKRISSTRKILDRAGFNFIPVDLAPHTETQA